jgi:F420-0:gamma-glutamyl ligase-like protein
MTKYKALAVTTRYWKPGTDYAQEIIDNVKGKIADGDFVVISEKAISTALGNIVDESSLKPNSNARFITEHWMRTIWGHLLSRLCRFSGVMLKNLQKYPLEMGSRHKQVALQYGGLLHALMFGSEWGIDGSNLAFAYVSLPLKNAQQIAYETQEKILRALHREICVMITDTDKTFSLRSFNFTPRPYPAEGIYSFGGVIAYVIGRMFKFRRRATPIAVAGRVLPAETALQIAQIADRTRGSGTGRTVWDMAARFKTDLDAVSWEMLETAKHKPIVLLRTEKE